MVKSIESPRHEFKLDISAGGWDFWDLIFRFTIRYLISNSPFNGSVYNRYREKRIEINKKDLIYLYTEYFVTFSREAKYTSDFVNYRSSFFSYSGNVGKFTRSVHTRKIYIHDWRKEYEFWDGREGRRVASRNIHRRHDNTPCTRHCFD